MEELVKKIQQGNQRALARAITMIENDHPEKLKLMDLINRSEKSHIISGLPVHRVLEKALWSIVSSPCYARRISLSRSSLSIRRVHLVGEPYLGTECG